MTEQKRCSAPYIGFFYRTGTNKVAPCCHYSQHFDPSLYDNKKIGKHVNKKMQNECQICWDKETFADKSLRQWFNKLENDNINEINKIKYQPLWADIRTSNYCNLQCNMCSTADSSKIQSFIQKNPHMSKYFKQSATGSNQDIDLQTDFSKLKYLKLAGGEPTIDPYCNKFLDKFINDYNASQVELVITTNATKVIPFFKKYKDKFKKITTILSIDAIGETYNFIRYPAKWKNVKENISHLLKIKDVDINMNIVLQPYNLVTVDEWLPFVSDFLNERVEGKVDFLNCTNPTHFSTSAMSPAAIETVLEKLVHVEKNFTNIQPKIKELHNLLSNAEYNHKDNKILKNHLKSISKIRKINYIEKIPELKHLL